MRSCKEGTLLFSTDETVREDTNVEVLAKLKPAFKSDGTVTAGNAPGVNDGASAVVVTSLARPALGIEPMARIVTRTSGVEPRRVMMAPVETVRNSCRRLWSGSEVDLVEVNEAFSVAALAVTRAGFGSGKSKRNGAVRSAMQSVNQARP